MSSFLSPVNGNMYELEIMFYILLHSWKRRERQTHPWTQRVLPTSARSGRVTFCLLSLPFFFLQIIVHENICSWSLMAWWSSPYHLPKWKWVPCWICEKPFPKSLALLESQSLDFRENKLCSRNRIGVAPGTGLHRQLISQTLEDDHCKPLNAAGAWQVTVRLASVKLRAWKSVFLT